MCMPRSMHQGRTKRQDREHMCQIYSLNVMHCRHSTRNTRSKLDTEGDGVGHPWLTITCCPTALAKPLETVLCVQEASILNNQFALSAMNCGTCHLCHHGKSRISAILVKRVNCSFRTDAAQTHGTVPKDSASEVRQQNWSTPSRPIHGYTPWQV